MNGLRIGSMCSGYGGLDLAIQSMVGGELAWVADNDPGAAKILAHRCPDVPNLGDITAADWGAVEPVDILAAGFPCQDVSCAGARKGLRAGNRTGVWAYVAKAIGALRPPLVVLENVRGLLSAGADSPVEPCPWCLGDQDIEHALRALGAVLGDLADLGYDAEWATVSAADAGAPHRRERVFIAARPAAHANDLVLPAGSRIVALRPTGRERCDARPDRQPGDPGEGSAAQDADRTAGGERWITAPGQAPGGRSWADAGRSGGAPAIADTASDRHGNARTQSQRGIPAAVVAGSLADTNGDGFPWSQERDSQPQVGRPGHEQRRVDPLRRVLDWGNYAPAIRRWEAVIGRPAPRPTEPGRTGERLSPRFVEWMQGLEPGWVTDVPGLSRNQMLKALGNGVVPQQASMALRLLLARTDAEVAA